MKSLVNIILVFSILISFSFVPKNKKFPEINYYTLDGKHITNSFFNGKKTIVIMGHLGCPSAMLLLKDIETLNVDSVQTLTVLENTMAQVVDFNASDKNPWSSLRTHFRMNPITKNIIAECVKENVKKHGDNIIIGAQCSKLSRKIRTKSSPTMIFVDGTGNIYKKIEGYYDHKEQNHRIRTLLNQI